MLQISSTPDNPTALPSSTASLKFKDNSVQEINESSRRQANIDIYSG